MGSVQTFDEDGVIDVTDKSLLCLLFNNWNLYAFWKSINTNSTKKSHTFIASKSISLLPNSSAGKAKFSNRITSVDGMVFCINNWTHVGNL